MFVLGFNALLLTGYSLSCHSLRHLDRRAARLLLVHAPDAGPLHAVAALTGLNRHHMAWAWASLLTVTFADVYVRLLALGVIIDPAIHF